MKITLPVIVKDELKNGVHEFETKEVAFECDFSLGCQMRWEARFPENAKNETIADYVARISQNQKADLAHIISMLKAVYCFFDVDETFAEFVKRFSASNAEYRKNLIDGINSAMQIFIDEATEKN